MEKIEKDGCVAVLYSPGFGAGWSTWAESAAKGRLRQGGASKAGRQRG